MENDVVGGAALKHRIYAKAITFTSHSFPILLHLLRTVTSVSKQVGEFHVPLLAFVVYP